MILIWYDSWKTKKISNEYLIYFGLLILFPTFSGTLDAMARFAILAFPMFISMSILSEGKKFNTAFKVTYVIFILMLIFTTIRYVNEEINFCKIIMNKFFC